MPGMAAPVQRPARELPVYSWSEWDSVSLVKGALRDLEGGLFEQAASVVDAMGRDDRITGCLLTRIEALPALPFTMVPGEDGGGRAQTIAEEADELFEAMAPNAELLRLHHWAVMLGLGVGQLIWDRDGGRWQPRLTVWHPRHLYWRQDIGT